MTRRILVPLAALLLWVAPARLQSAPLGLDEARQYLVELVNRDRASAGLKPVVLDDVATAAGQKHAEEMATYQYLAHWNLAGELPDQRYTAAGGTDSVQENVYLRAPRRGAAATEALTLDPAPTFTREEIEDIEAGYFNEVPPTDGHRRNILAAPHNRVGIGLARASGLAGSCVANTQEFVNRYVQVEAIPRTAGAGQVVRVSGRVLEGCRFRQVSVSRSPLPAARTVADLQRTRSYAIPRSFASYWPEPYVSPRPVRLGADGSFAVDVALSDGMRPGVYYVGVWVTRQSGLDCLASRRAVVVR